MDHGMHAMRGMLGSYGMSREASGTSWQPESTPHMGVHAMWNGWSLMTHGFANLVLDRQSGPRGADKTFSENMLMGMASRNLGAGRLGLRAMVSAEPWTIRAQGCIRRPPADRRDRLRGVTPLVDRQHPHDLLMELAGTYSIAVGAHDSVFLYAGLPGEPALGPATYMHRFSGMDNPEAPLGHHSARFDARHLRRRHPRLDPRRRQARRLDLHRPGQPDQNRTNFESPKMDSWSLRASWQPAPDWSFQVSHGYLHSPEQLEPDANDRRTTASAMYNRPLADGNWQTTFAWGRNDRSPGTSTNSFLLESAVTAGRHTVFGRVERQQNDELLGHEVFEVGKLSLGYIYDFLHRDNWRTGVGLLGSVALVPSELKSVYGDSPVSGMAFWR